jgi:hypothetical protein
MTRLYDVVRLRHDHPSEGLRAGTIGTIVHVVEQPTVAYVVEVADRQGRTQALVTLRPDQIEIVAETTPGLAASG